MKAEVLARSDSFPRRHIGPRTSEVAEMLAALGLESLDALIEQTVPAAIRRREPLAIPAARTEHELLAELRAMVSANQVFRSYIGQGYYNCITPPPVLRNITENPGWYTQYTPYQAEIAQGRLEALINFQTMVGDLTGLPLSNSSLLDEGTAAAEAMTMCRRIGRSKRAGFFVADDCHPQTIEVIRTRAAPLGITLHTGSVDDIDFEAQDLFGVLVQYPGTDGRVHDYRALATRTHEAGALLVAAVDLLAMIMLEPPGAWGADIAVGSTQRFGVPVGLGGPHAAFLSTHDEHKRHVPGRIIGVSKDARGKPAYRLALQTREQHIRRDRATSNICTAQVLLAVMASMYAVYHGPEGLRRIATRVHGWTAVLAEALRRLGLAHSGDDAAFFDTLKVAVPAANRSAVLDAAIARRINLRRYSDGALGVSLDETTARADVQDLIEAFAGGKAAPVDLDDVIASVDAAIPAGLARTTPMLEHPVFSMYHSEHELTRYMHRLQSRDLSLTTSMIPLGSCTMKLNATTEMIPVTWPEIGQLHPFAPPNQWTGYATLFSQLESWLGEITGLPFVSLQPNAGAQGEYAGLLAIRGYQAAQKVTGRDVCLIPTSAHGTNPASAVMAGFRVVPVACDDHGNIDVADLRAKAEQHKAALAALMVTYPSTHGVFEASIREICSVIHEYGGQVYMDGANMNAQVGLCRPGDFGADVVHLNLHKTFAIPHGGGGPGMGPIAVAEHLAPYLPGHPSLEDGPSEIGPVSAAPYGSPSILPISWSYIALLGGDGVTRATQVAILNANYMAKRLDGPYQILYTGDNGRVAHEFVIDCRPFKKTAGVEVEDIAKRLMDYGFHAPTMSWPVPGTLMIEPTESESKVELDRFCDAMIAIRAEIQSIEDGALDRADNPLKHAPHTADTVTASEWTRGYSREQAAYPMPYLRDYKFWPAVARVDNTYGDRNLVCACPPLSAFTDDE